MSDTFKTLIRKLYKTSMTPFRESPEGPLPIKPYNDNDDIVFHINKLRKSVTHLGMTDEDIQAVVIFTLQLVNTQTDLEGALLVVPSVKYLFKSMFDEIHLPPGDASRIAIEAIYTQWVSILRNAPSNNKRSYEHHPDYEKSPLLTFHVESLSSCTAPGTHDFYTTYAYELHKRLRFNESLNLGLHTHDKYATTARFFFLHCSDVTKRRTDLKPNALSSWVIDEFKRGYMQYRMEHQPSDKMQETAEDHVARLKDLWGQRRISRRSSFRKGVYRGIKERDELVPPGGDEVPEFLLSDLPIEDDEDEKDDWAGSEGNPKEDWNFVDLLENTPTLTDEDPEIRDKRWIDNFHLRNFHFYWQKKHLGLFHYGLLYQAMRDIWNKKPVTASRTLVLYFYLLIHTGMSTKKLLDLQPCEKATALDKDKAELRKIGTRYYILNPTVVNLKTKPEPGICYPTSGKVYIPVPNKITNLFPSDIMKHKYVFRYKIDNKLKHLEPKLIFAFLEDINRSFNRYQPKLTLARITSSFQPLYHGHYGLDPIVACHISGKDRQRLFGSQMHYIYVKHTTLAKSYLSTFSTVDYNIQKNLNECIADKLIRIEGKPTLAKKAEIDVTHDDHFDGYGSPFIPMNDYLAKMISTIEKSIRNEKEIILRHNLYIIYTYLALQFSTSLRPRNNPQLPWTRFNAQAGTILIKDKLSQRYREERLLPLPDITLTLLRNLKSGSVTVHDFIARNLNMIDQSEKAKLMLFFINETGRFTPVTIKEMNKRLSDIGINYDLPPNMPRHVHRTYLFNNGVSSDLADIWMGHQHTGREVMSVISSTAYSDAVRICLPQIANFMRDLGFTAVSYLPEHA